MWWWSWEEAVVGVVGQGWGEPWGVVVLGWWWWSAELVGWSSVQGVVSGVVWVWMSWVVCGIWWVGVVVVVGWGG